MKKFGIVLLSLGLIAAFGMSAYAVTPEFTGQLYARGNYLSNPSMLDQNGAAGRDSYSYSDQRLRTFFRLKIVDGLTITTRMDALEAIWGRDQLPTRGINGITSAKTAREYNTSNLSFEQVWTTFKTGIGTFDVGYKSGTPYTWGTKFLNAPGTAPGVVYTNKFGDFGVLAGWNKTLKGDFTKSTALDDSEPALLQSDVDRDYYSLAGTYKFKGGDAGLLVNYFRYADKSGSSTATNGVKTEVYVFDPYIRTKLGPVDFEAEAYYGFGKDKSEAGNTAGDKDYKMKGIYANGKYKMGPAYIGGIFTYMSGTDQAAVAAGTDKSGMISDFSYSNDTDIWGSITPTILFGYGYQGLGLGLPNGVPMNDNYPATMDNVYMFQLYGGYAVAKNLDLNFKLSYAKAAEDGAATGWQSKDYGKELDLKATYKIYDQLTYNVGFAYLWTGDWVKGTDAAAQTENVYYVSHWIDLNF